MPKRHVGENPLPGFYRAQLDRFKAVDKEADARIKAARDAAYDLLLELTKGQGSSGEDRIKALRAAGQPYGRNASKLDTPRLRFGGKRGAKYGKRSRVAEENRQDFPQLPLGIIGGKLRQSAFAQTSNLTLTAGFDNRAGDSINRVLPFGTNNMVASGLFLPGEKGAFGKGMKAIRRAQAKAFFDPLKKP
jgi:hypothetical protein